MILANGCSHTHGTNHADEYGYKDKLWPNIAGKLLGDTNVVNLAKGGDSAGAIADSTIHWLETNTIKPDMVIIQWTYKDRFDIPYHRMYADDPFRDGCFVDDIREGKPPVYSDKFTYLNQYPREGMVRITSTGSYLEKNQETGMLQKGSDKMRALGLDFPNILYQAGYKQDVHPYYLKNHDDPHIQEIIDYYQQYVDYRETYLSLPTIHNDLKHKWAMAQNHVASYCEAHNIPYYWFTNDSWYDKELLDFLYLKPKTGNEMFANLGRIDFWLERQGIIANGDIVGMGISEDEDERFNLAYVDDHRGEDGHYFIGEMVYNFIKHGIEPKVNDENKELLKANILARPNLTQTSTGHKSKNAFARDNKDYDNPNAVHWNENDPRSKHFKELLAWAEGNDKLPAPWMPVFIYY